MTSNKRLRRYIASRKGDYSSRSLFPYGKMDAYYLKEMIEDRKRYAVRHRNKEIIPVSDSYYSKPYVSREGHPTLRIMLRRRDWVLAWKLEVRMKEPNRRYPNDEAAASIRRSNAKWARYSQRMDDMFIENLLKNREP